MQANRDNSLFLRKVKEAHWLWPVLGNQPNLSADAERAALGEHPGRRRDQRDHPGPDRDPDPPRPARPEGTGFEGAEAGPAHRAVRHVQEERPVAHPGRGRPLPHQPRPDETTPEDLLAHVRGHWRVEHAHWLRDVNWKEDKSLIRTGNAPQVWSAIANLVISLFRIHGVTSYAPKPAAAPRTPAAPSRSWTSQPSHLAKHHPRLWQTPGWDSARTRQARPAIEGIYRQLFNPQLYCGPTGGSTPTKER